MSVEENKIALISGSENNCFFAALILLENGDIYVSADKKGIYKISFLNFR